MGLTSGTKLGPYEVRSPIGAGGMGEVYLARDTRLDRTVAIKTLPAHLSENPEAKQRFEREARTISSLNHPNICTLHDIGHQDGVDYLVMEYLEGETLAERLRKGPMPVAQVFKYGIEICDGLERAHRSGVVHRDLKPGNIMLTRTGAKLMDFGLAKSVVLTTDASSGLTATMTTPLGSSPLTAQGTVVGTFQYMSPEQVEGKEADARSDIFALGAVLYEMATGKRAFEGKTAASAMAAVLERSPASVSSVQPMMAAGFDHVVQECLAKDPDDRWQSAGDVGLELRWIGAGGANVAAAAPHVPAKSQWPWLAALGATTLGLLIAVLVLSLRGHEPSPALRSYLTPPQDTIFDFVGDFAGPPVISRDGSAIVFCARKAKEPNALWVQSLTDLAPRKLEGSEGASFPFWSYDERFVGFFADGRLKKLPAAGGPVTVIADAPNARGGAWNRDNVIVYEPDYRDSLWRVSALGGTPSRLTKFDAGKHTTHRWPVFLPDQKHFLFFATSHSGDSEHGIYFASLDDGSYKRVLDADSDAQYVSGYLIYHQQSQLLAQKFDAATGAVSGDPIMLENFVEYDAGTWHTTFTASQNGLLVYEPGSRTGAGTDLVSLDRTGKSLGKVAERAAYKGSGRLSPDGKRLAISVGDPEADVWVFDLVHGSKTRLTFGEGTHLMVSWSPDGQKIVYVTQHGATLMAGTSLRMRLANGGGQEEVLLQTGTSLQATVLSPQFSPDGKYLLYMQQSGPTDAEIKAMPLTGDRKPFTVLKPQSAQTRIVQFRLSPDGRWLAYSSTESGREELYVTHFPSGQGRWQISQEGATFPTWRGDGKELWFLGPDGALRYVTVNAKSEEFESDPVRELFQLSYTAPLGDPFDISADGQRIVVTTLPESPPTPLVLVTNWMNGVKK
ncbi:MAG TPA: protein kinase [Candidatus Solibacter sp.]|nr:protein kinase [Candidatus Solibacter sp.]